jgi:hypothetical protein
MMGTVLTGIAVLGLGALLISVYVFAAAARNFVSDDDENGAGELQPEPGILTSINARSGDDRRKAGSVLMFPTTINGVLIPEDRRHLPDRRYRR